MRNLFAMADTTIATLGKIKSGLSFWKQANNFCEFTMDGIHWVRNPNITDGSYSGEKTTFGGIYINTSDFVDYLIKGHTYLLTMDVNGTIDTSNYYFRFSYNYGWEGDNSLMPKPTILYQEKPKLENNNATVCIMFKIEDDIYKTAKKSFSNFEAGKKYLSYKQFVFGHNYSNNTGSGTNLYVRNLRLIDLEHYKGCEVFANGSFMDLIISEQATNKLDIMPLAYKNIKEY